MSSEFLNDTSRLVLSDPGGGAHIVQTNNFLAAICSSCCSDMVYKEGCEPWNCSNPYCPRKIKNGAAVAKIIVGNHDTAAHRRYLEMWVSEWTSLHADQFAVEIA